MTWWTCWSWTQSKIAPDIIRKNDIRSCFFICAPSPHSPVKSYWMTWLVNEGRRGQTFSRCAAPLISFLHYSEAWEVNSHCWIDVPTHNCCATVPFLLATRACCIGLYLSPPSPLIGYSCAPDDFRLQKQRCVVLNYLHIAHWSRH